MEARNASKQRFRMMGNAIRPCRRGSVRLFNGSRSSGNNWDGLRRDAELWYEDGDCLVYLHVLGASQRGPSLQVRYADVQKLGSQYLSKKCLRVRDVSSPTDSVGSASDSGYASSQMSNLGPASYEIYIPAPARLSKDQAYLYHLTTRNYFAYCSSRPLVGEKLGTALTDLWDRLREWAPQRVTLRSFLNYCEEQDYLDLAENPEHALACLVFAEYTRMRDLWIDAFVHCVGMHDRLESSSEYECLGNTTKALITRASLEMDLHIERVVRAIGSFLEEGLSAEHLGLTKPARDHLDRFRSFLHNYYVDKLGYFPPGDDALWDKRLWTKMYHSFHMLYDYLVDTESSTDRNCPRGLNGGICVAQNLQAFDHRHGYTPLPHPLPLLPEEPGKKPSAESQKGLRNFKLGRRDNTPDLRTTARHALARATNSQDPNTISCDLVIEYRSFERQRLEEKLSLAEARKIRWILIYGTLQMLISITRAPKEVRDTETPSYPLCVLTIGGPSWLEQETDTEDDQEAFRSHLSADFVEPQQDHDGASERISIHPDCEADNAGEYFSSHGLSRRVSEMSLDMTPPPLRIVTQISRTASIRSSVHSSVHALHRSVVGSLARRGNNRRSESSPQIPQKSNAFCEILVEGYGNGIGADEEETRRRSLLNIEQILKSESNPLADFDFGLDNKYDEPMLQEIQLDTADISRSGSDSYLSAMVSSNSNSSRSSSKLDSYDSPITDTSLWDDEFDKRFSDLSMECSPIQDVGKSLAFTPPRRHSHQQRQLNLGVRTNCFSVNVGCYTPTGYKPPIGPIVPPLSRFSDTRTLSSESVASTASSVYPEDSIQAAEIEEEEMRGRRRSRALDLLSRADMAAQGRTFCIPE